MRLTRLRHEQGTNEKRMIGPFDHTDFAFGARTADPHRALFQGFDISRIDTEVSIILLGAVFEL